MATFFMHYGMEYGVTNINEAENLDYVQLTWSGVSETKTICNIEINNTLMETHAYQLIKI